MKLEYFRKINIDEELNADIDNFYKKYNQLKQTVYKLIIFLFIVIGVFFISTMYLHKQYQECFKIKNDLFNKTETNFNNTKIN